MDNAVDMLSEDFDYEEVEAQAAQGTDLSGLENFEMEDDMLSEDLDADSNEVQDMIAELTACGYIVDDNMRYDTIKALHDRLFFANDMEQTRVFLVKCNESFDRLKSTLRTRSGYTRNTHMKKQQSYSVFVDSRDAELNEIDCCIRSDVLNKILEHDVNELAALDIEQLVEEEYQYLVEKYPNLSVLHTDLNRLRRHITRTVTDSVHKNLRTISAFYDPQIVDSSSIIKYSCPTHVDNVIKQVFTEDGMYYFLDNRGHRVNIDKPVIHLLSCLGDVKPVISWVPTIYESNGATYSFTSDDYFRFLQAAQGLFRDRSSAKSDCIDLGISINMFMQINDHILFNAPEDLREEKTTEFVRYSLEVTDDEIMDACKKLRSVAKAKPGMYDVGSLARALCVRTNNSYDTRIFQALVGLLQSLDVNVYYNHALNLQPIMRCRCDLLYLRSVSVITESVQKHVNDMYMTHLDAVRATVDMATISELIEYMEHRLQQLESRRETVICCLQEYSQKLRYIPISKYDTCALDLLARYVDENSYNVFITIANGMVISNSAGAFLNGYTFQSKTYMQGNIKLTDSIDGLKRVMHNVESKLSKYAADTKKVGPVITKACESLDCMYDQSASDLIRCMHYDSYANVPILVDALLSSVESVEYSDELALLQEEMETIQNATSFDELPAGVMTALFAVVNYIQAHASNDYQEKITMNTFADVALGMPAEFVEVWLQISRCEVPKMELDLQAFSDFQQMKYAREIAEGTLGISKHILNLILTDRFENVEPGMLEELLSADYYKRGIAYLLGAVTRAGSGLSAAATEKEQIQFAQDQMIASAILDDGGEQAMEIWLAKYLRYLGE